MALGLLFRGAVFKDPSDHCSGLKGVVWIVRDTFYGPSGYPRPPLFFDLGLQALKIGIDSAPGTQLGELLFRL